MASASLNNHGTNINMCNITNFFPHWHPKAFARRIFEEIPLNIYEHMCTLMNRNHPRNCCAVVPRIRVFRIIWNRIFWSSLALQYDMNAIHLFTGLLNTIVIYLCFPGRSFCSIFASASLPTGHWTGIIASSIGAVCALGLG